MQSRKLIPSSATGSTPHGMPISVNPRNFPPTAGGMRPPMIQRPPNGPLMGGQPRMPMPAQGNGQFPGQGPWHAMGPGPPPQRAPMHGGMPRPGMPMLRLPPNQRPPQGMLRPGMPPDPRNPHPQMQDWGDNSSHPGHHSQPQGLNQGHMQGNPQMPPRPPGMIFSQIS